MASKETKAGPMNVVVVGCGRVGAQLADRLYEKGHRVAVMDQDPRSFENLSSAFRGRTVEGDVLARDALVRAGIDRADGLAAVMSSDAMNAVVARVARTEFGIANVVARNYDPRFASLLKAVGVQAISTTRWGARRFEELLSETAAHSVFSAGSGEVRVYELVVPAAWAGRAVGDVTADSGGRVVALTRAGTAGMPDDNALLETGDVLHVGCTPKGIQVLQSRLRGKG